MSDLLSRVVQQQACIGIVGTITLPAELHRELVAEVERLRKERNNRQESLTIAQTEVVNQRAEAERLGAALTFLERRAPAAIGCREFDGVVQYWVGVGQGPHYGDTVLEAIEKAADAARRSDGL